MRVRVSDGGERGKEKDSMRLILIQYIRDDEVGRGLKGQG